MNMISIQNFYIITIIIFLAVILVCEYFIIKKYEKFISKYSITIVKNSKYVIIHVNSPFEKENKIYKIYKDYKV